MPNQIKFTDAPNFQVQRNPVPGINMRTLKGIGQMQPVVMAKSRKTKGFVIQIETIIWKGNQALPGLKVFELSDKEQRAEAKRRLRSLITCAKHNLDTAAKQAWISATLNGVYGEERKAKLKAAQFWHKQ